LVKSLHQIKGGLMNRYSKVLFVRHRVWCSLFVLFVLAGCAPHSEVVQTFNVPQVKRFVGMKHFYFTHSNAGLRVNPDKNSRVVRELPDNTLVEELFRDSIGWSQVKTGDNQVGWIPTAMLSKDPVRNRPESRPGAAGAAPPFPVEQTPRPILPEEGPIDESPVDDQKPSWQWNVPVDEPRSSSGRGGYEGYNDEEPSPSY
jgi:uncharacterized protein YgiM (DUF1202 family)